MAILLIAAVPRADAQDRSPADKPITLALAGDLLGPFHRLDLSGDPDFAHVADLFRQADAGFANAEVATFDLKQFTGYPAAETGGGYPVQVHAIANDFHNMGITLVSKANNHATDFGAEGLLATLGNLARAGIVVGGAGVSDTAARAPVYLDTVHGSVALVAAASTFTPSSVAGAAIVRHDTTSKPRPGVSALHVRQVRQLTAALFASLQQAAGPLATKEGSALRIGDNLFVQDEAVGLRWEMKPADEKAILAAVDEARSHADLVLFSIHAHETAGNDDEPPPLPFEPMLLHKANEAPSPNDPRPASFEIDLSHKVVDHGADVVVRHGPHVLGGIEVYKGKPIFYGLGSLFLDFGGQRVLTTTGGEKIAVPEAWFDSVVPVCAFRGHRLNVCTLYPIAIDPAPGVRSGVPGIATGVRARGILEQLRTLSAVFGTHVDIVDNVGVIRALPI